ncbi:male sterility protein-domain-containing protein [Nemania sp. FL0031]|nr:male sterility protein-domain-containing protein [Nemania sp. FL0031]
MRQPLSSVSVQVSRKPTKLFPLMYASSLVLITRPDRPFIHTGKGTIQQGSSIAQYQGDIDKLYANAEGDQDRWPSLGVSDSFFDRGMDSLQSLRLARVLRSILHRPDLALSKIYQNPTIEQLAAAITKPIELANQTDVMKQLQSNVRGLIQQIPKPESLNPVAPGTVNVLLTGSTGTLGTLILHTLLQKPSIGHIFCANRGADRRSAQIKRFSAAGLTADNLDTRVTFLQTDLSHPLLGLEEEQYKALQTRVGLIIHNAWPVNFNLSLPTFRPQLAGLVNLCALSATAPRSARLLFVSSIGAVGGPALDGKAAPEAVLGDLGTPGSMGIPVTIARVGQVAGSMRHSSMWNIAEWLPSLVVSSLQLGCLPEDLGLRFSEVDWIPSDYVAEAIVEFAVKLPSSKHAIGSSRNAEVLNLRNSNTTIWGKLLPTIVEVLSKHQDTSRQVEVVKPSVWLDRLRQSMVAATKSDNIDMATVVKANPALKLLDFYHHGLWATDTTAFQPMSVELAVQSSSVLRDMPPVQPEWICK